MITAISSGETPPAEEIADGIVALQGMLDSWSLERLLVFNKIREVFPLVGAQETYTMGTGGNFNTTPPVDILAANIQIPGNTPPLELPLNIINLQQRADIGLKDLQSTIPRDLYFENTAPLTKLTLYPVPSVAQNIAIYSEKVLATITSANMALTLPPGYERAIRYNLALEWAGEFGKELSATDQRIAMSSKANIKRKNYRPRFMKSDPIIMGRATGFNILTREGGR